MYGFLGAILFLMHHHLKTQQAIPLDVSEQSEEFNLATFEILRNEIVKLVQVGARLRSHGDIFIESV